MKHKKKALFHSLVSLILCFSMFVGTTFAWFTDSVSSGTNLIAAGNLDIEMEYLDSNGNWKKVNENTEVLDKDALWEPGHTEVAYLKISNAGDLALKYALGIGIVQETGSINSKGEPFKLSNYIEFGVVENESEIVYAERIDARNALTNSKKINEGYSSEYTLNSNGDVRFATLVVYMPEEVGNVANYATGETPPEIKLGIELVATQVDYESDSFGTGYDTEAEMPGFSFPQSALGDNTSVDVTTDAEDKVAAGITIQGANTNAIIPVGVQLEEGTEKLTLEVTSMNQSGANVTLGENEAMRSLNVHVQGVSADNTIPMEIYIKEAAAKGLNAGNLKLYHVENGTTVEMTAVEEFTAHNQFKYDPATGDITLYMATFSEVALVADTTAAWNGGFDYTWYDASKTELTIANADQLAAFGAIVGGMNGQAQDDFAGKTIKLIADINLADDEKNNDSDKIFYPIGYYNSTKSYEKVSGGSVTSNVSSFSGTFDGQGHTIKNFYQNTWEMFGDYNDGYDGKPNHYKDAMGLFGYVVNGSIKNLTVDSFSSDGEFTPTGVIAAYAVNSTFENIAITNCNPRVYNTGNGGIIGIGGNSDDTSEKKLTFTNITIDNTNKISALWGSWDVACGGLMGMFRGYSTVEFTNCHVAAQIDVYNDVCGNYQYYWYRYAGMIIGSLRGRNTTDSAGYTVPDMTGITAENCTVHFGDWNDYYYCELVANSLASYTHDHQFSRLEEIASLDVIKSGDTWTKAGNFLLISGDTKTCYHITKNDDGTLKQHLHSDAGVETVNGETVLKENNQIVYLPFNQLFQGDGWGVKHVPIYNDGKTYFEGITILDREVADSVVKFEKADTAKESYTTGTTVAVGELYKAIISSTDTLKINDSAVMVSVNPVGEGSTARGTYSVNASDWTQGTLTFSGIGVAEITITDYYFCTPTTIIVNVVEPESVDKFDLVFENTNTYLYRVGNQNTVTLGSLFKANDGVEIGNVTVNVTPLNEAAVSGAYTENADWKKGTIKFEGTGPVRVTIDDDLYTTETVLYLEVVDAKNITKAESATSNDVVLLNDISGTFVVSNGHTFYGNGFTVTLPTSAVQEKGQGFTGYISIGAAQDSGSANGGNLDNVKIEGPVYPEMYIYRNQAEITDKNDPDYGSGSNMRYFKNSVIVYGGNVTISNCYISGSRTALCLRGGNNVTIENTTLSGGSYANMQICAGSTVTLRDLTTVQVDEADSYGKGKTAHGLGIAVDSDVVDIYIEGELNQNNWLNKERWDKIVPSNYQSQFPKFFTDNSFKQYWHYLNGVDDPYVNLAFIYACNWNKDKIHDNRNNVDYGTEDATIAGIAGGVYSKVNTVGGNVITDANLTSPEYVAPGFNPIAPTLNFDNTPNQDDDDANDTNDTYCVYNESTGTLKIGVSGDSKTLDLSKISVSKNGTNLTHTAYLNGTKISGNSVTIKVADGAKQVLTFKATSKDAGYDKEGNPIEGSIEYTWTVTVEIAVLSYPAPVWNMGGDYQFDGTNCVYAYKSTSSGYGEAVPIYEGIKINYYDKSGKLVELDLSGTTTHPTGSNNSNSNAFIYTLSDGSTLTMKFSSGWKSGATTHQFTTYESKVYIYPQSLGNDNYIRAKVGNQDFDVKIAYTFTDPNGQSISETMQWYNVKDTNSKITTVQWKKFDSTNGEECITSDTLITLANGSQVRVDSLTGNEELLVWNLETGTYDTASIVFVDTDEEMEYEIIHLYFSDGSDVKVISEHGFFDIDLGKYVYIDALNYADYVGHRFVAEGKTSKNTWREVTLDKVVIEKEVTTAWSPVTVEHLCYYTNGVLSMPGGIDGLFNIFEVDTDTMRYDAQQKRNDIEKYGLLTLEDFGGLITEEAFEAFNGAYLKVAIGKGMLTWEDIAYLAERYIPLMK